MAHLSYLIFAKLSIHDKDSNSNAIVAILFNSITIHNNSREQEDNKTNRIE